MHGGKARGDNAFIPSLSRDALCHTRSLQTRNCDACSSITRLENTGMCGTAFLAMRLM